MVAEDPRYHIRLEKEDVGDYVIIVGDRGRVERVAKYFENPRKVGENREYLTWTGFVSGKKVSVMSTGMGAPAVSIAVEELATLDVKVIIRVGTTGALQKNLKLGDGVIAVGSVRRDGTTLQYLPPEFPAVADVDVVNALIESARRNGIRYHVGNVYSTDSYYARLFDPESHSRYIEKLIKAGVLSVEMEVGALYVVGSIKRIKTGSILVVREELSEEGEYIQAGPRYEEGLEKVIKTAVDSIAILADRGI